MKTPRTIFLALAAAVFASGFPELCATRAYAGIYPHGRLSSPVSIPIKIGEPIIVKDKKPRH